MDFLWSPPSGALVITSTTNPDHIVKLHDQIESKAVLSNGNPVCTTTELGTFVHVSEDIHIDEDETWPILQ